MTGSMHTLWCDERIAYDGSQLRAHWLLQRFGLAGDAIVAFRGPCRVTLAEMADLADVDGPGIAGDDMVHFVWECFTTPALLLAVHRQRLLAAQAREVLAELAPAVVVRRDGDDLDAGQRAGPLRGQRDAGRRAGRDRDAARAGRRAPRLRRAAAGARRR